MPGSGIKALPPWGVATFVDCLPDMVQYGVTSVRPFCTNGDLMKIVSYLRVSTRQQGISGLGLDAQLVAIDAYAVQRHAKVIDTFTEIESGKVNARPELAKALHLAKVTGATLVIAKLDRLSRNAAFLLALRDSGVRFVAADMPDANELTVGIMAHYRGPSSRKGPWGAPWEPEWGGGIEAGSNGKRCERGIHTQCSG
jgi:Resolvase, N terminal domain